MGANSKKAGVSLLLLLLPGLEVLIDDGHSKKDSSAGSNSPHEISHDRESTNAHSAKSSSYRDITVKLLLEGGKRVAVALDKHLLLFELLGDIGSRGTRNLNPGLGKEGTGREHEDNVEDGMQWVCSHLGEALGRGDVIDETSNRDHVASAVLEDLPPSEELDEKVSPVALVEQLGDKVEVGDKGRLKNDGHV